MPELFEQTFLLPARYRVAPGEFRDFSDSDIKEYVENTRKMLAGGLSVPVFPEHAPPGSPEGGPQFAEREGKKIPEHVAQHLMQRGIQPVQFEDALKNVGWLSDIRWNPQTGAGWYAVEITNPEYANGIKNGSIRFSSPEFREGYTDGLGRNFGRTIAHIALTPRPRSPLQGHLKPVQMGEGQGVFQFGLVDCIEPKVNVAHGLKPFDGQQAPAESATSFSSQDVAQGKTKRGGRWYSPGRDKNRLQQHLAKTILFVGQGKPPALTREHLQRAQQFAQDVLEQVKSSPSPPGWMAQMGSDLLTITQQKLKQLQFAEDEEEDGHNDETETPVEPQAEEQVDQEIQEAIDSLSSVCERDDCSPEVKQLVGDALQKLCVAEEVVEEGPDDEQPGGDEREFGADVDDEVHQYSQFANGMPWLQEENPFGPPPAGAAGQMIDPQMEGLVPGMETMPPEPTQPIPETNPDLKDKAVDDQMRMKMEAIRELFEQAGFALPANWDVIGNPEPALDSLLAALKTKIKADEEHEAEKAINPQDQMLREEVPMTMQMSEHDRELLALKARVDASNRKDIHRAIERSNIWPALKQELLKRVSAVQFSDDGQPEATLTISEVLEMVAASVPENIAFSADDLVQRKHRKSWSEKRLAGEPHQMTEKEAERYGREFAARNPGTTYQENGSR